MAYNFDARALTDPIDRADLKSFRATLGERFPRSHGGRLAGTTVAAIVFIAIGALFAIGGTISLFTGNVSLVATVFAAVGVVFIGIGVYTLEGNGGAARQYRLDRFAQGNAMQFHPGFSNPQLPGLLFHVGRKRHSTMLVRSDQPRFVEFGNYQYTTGSGKHSQTHRWGYIAVRLDAPLPNIVLDAAGNNGLFGSNLPVGLDKDQRLGLEGNFDEYFHLYAPAGYEPDALYLFTPDIMQRFMNNAAQLDVEIVDDWLFFYTGDNVSTLDADRWAWLFSVVGAMLDKIARWGRWRDERLQAASAAPVADDHAENPALQNPQTLQPPRGVADPGKRLKRRGFAWTAVITVVAFVLIQVLSRVL